MNFCSVRAHKMNTYLAGKHDWFLMFHDLNPVNPLLLVIPAVIELNKNDLRSLSNRSPYVLRRNPRLVGNAKSNPEPQISC